MRLKLLPFQLLSIIVLTITLVAAKPITNSAQKSAKEHVIKLQKDVELTDSQIVIIDKYAIEFFLANNNANSIVDKKVRFDKKRLILDQYKSNLDSILTPEQKAQLQAKIENRKQNAKGQ